MILSPNSLLVIKNLIKQIIKKEISKEILLDKANNDLSVEVKDIFTILVYEFYNKFSQEEIEYLKEEIKYQNDEKENQNKIKKVHSLIDKLKSYIKNRESSEDNMFGFNKSSIYDKERILNHEKNFKQCVNIFEKLKQNYGNYIPNDYLIEYNDDFPYLIGKYLGVYVAKGELLNFLVTYEELESLLKEINYPSFERINKYERLIHQTISSFCFFNNKNEQSPWYKEIEDFLEVPKCEKS